MAPAAGSVVLHLGLVGAIVLYGVLGGFFHHNLWGSPGTGGAIQVNLVSSALPLPSNQPVNQNVLSTENAEPGARAARSQRRSRPRTRPQFHLQGKQKKPEKETAPKTPPKQQQPTPTNSRRLWRAGRLIDAARGAARASQPAQPTSITATSAAALDGTSRASAARCRRTGTSRWWTRARRGERAPTSISPSLATASVSNVRLDRSSGSPTLDSSCLRAAQRVDTFGPLPAVTTKVPCWFRITASTSITPVASK